TPAGERYTRNGALKINSQGQIVTNDGSVVLGENGPITIQQTDHDLTIAADGRVTVIEGNNNRTESQRGRLRLVTFNHPQELQEDGANNFSAPAGLTPQPVVATAINIASGAIEKSNVNGVVEMTRMIEVTRNYTQIGSLIAAQGDLRKNAIEKLADVP